MGNRVRSGSWKLVANTRFQQEWELYNLRTDRTETVNLFNQREDKAQELKTLWQAWATRAYVCPAGRQEIRNENNIHHSHRSVYCFRTTGQT